MTRLEQATRARLAEIRDIARSGQTELTGKHVTSGRHGYEEHSRHFGGMRSSYPELARLPERDTPKKLAAAIDRGKGKVYRRVHDAVRRGLEPDFPQTRTRTEKPTVPAHRRLTAKCKTCGRLHGKGEHRFHGKGAMAKTHLFSFNPRQSAKRRKPVESMTGRRGKANPGRVVIYGRLLRIEAQKTQPHICDAGCKKVNHRYFHDFKPGAKIFGLPNGDLLIQNRG